MSAGDRRLRANRNEVAASIIDGEAIIINLSNGLYYSMDKVGAILWALIDSGRTPDQIIETIAEHYGAEEAQVANDVHQLIDQLLVERLVGFYDGSHAPRPEPKLPNGELVYEAPRLNVYTDMGDLLALDPPLPRIEEEPWPDEGR